MSMADWITSLDNQIIAHKRKLLQSKGKISHEEAMKKAEAEFQLYRAREMKQLISDFDKAVKFLADNKKDEE